jgi:hypothetical protein
MSEANDFSRDPQGPLEKSPTPEPLSEVDCAALWRAMRMARRDPMRRRQLDAMMETGRDKVEVAKFASYVCQADRLNLKPWETAPCHISVAKTWVELDASGPDHRHRRIIEAQQLVRRLLEAGLSKYEPDPVLALEKARRA